MSRWMLALLCCCSLGALAADPRPFVAGSFGQIAAERVGKPYVLAFWSLECGHCREELALLSELKRDHAGLDLVMVAADTPELAPMLAATLAEYRLGQVEAWVFADPVPERLRFEIDRKWRGELPRTYLFDARHQAEAVTGPLPRARFADWLRRLDPSRR